MHAQNLSIKSYISLGRFQINYNNEYGQLYIFAQLWKIDVFLNDFWCVKNALKGKYIFLNE